MHEGFAVGFMPELMRRFRAAHAQSQLQLHVGAPDEVSALLSRGEADIALKYAVAPEGIPHRALGARAGVRADVP